MKYQLEPCRECGHLVSKSAKACPGCGATDPVEKKNEGFPFSIVFFVIAFFAVVLVLNGSPKKRVDIN